MTLPSEILVLIVSFFVTCSDAIPRSYVSNLTDLSIPDRKPFGMRLFLTRDHNKLNLAWLCQVPEELTPVSDFSRNISIQIWYSISAWKLAKEETRRGPEKDLLSVRYDHADVTQSRLIIAYVNTTLELRKNRTLTYALRCGNETTSVYEVKYLYWDEDIKFKWNMAAVGSLGRFNTTLITLDVLKTLRDNLGNLLLAVPGGIVADHTLKDDKIKEPVEEEVTWKDWVNWLLYFQDLLATIPIVASPSELDLVPYTNRSYARSHYKTFIEIPLDTPDKLDETLWYSFDYRNLHIVAICSFCDISDGSPQYKWLEADLAANNKSLATHWTMLMGHEPIYYQTESYDKDTLSTLRKQVDKLLTKYKVDFAIWSHDRWYERSYAMTSNLTVGAKTLHSAIYDPNGTIHYTCGTGGIELQSYNIGRYSYSAYFDSSHYGTCLFRKEKDDTVESKFIQNGNKIGSILINSDDIEIIKTIPKPPPNKENHFTRFMKIFAIALVGGAVIVAVAFLVLKFLKKRDPSYIENRIRNVRYRFRGSSNPANLHVTLENETEPTVPEQDERDTVMLLEDETEPATINTNPAELVVWK